MVDERTDVFSLGIVMYEMMAQREPFRGADIGKTFDNIVNEDPTPPRLAAPHRVIPQTLEAICLKALEKNPNDRYQSMTAMMSAVNKFRNDSLLRDIS